jgi:uncharacterized protein YbaR (Trm112 family)
VVFITLRLVDPRPHCYRAPGQGSIVERSNIFRCPRCKGPLVATEVAHECHACRLAYLIMDGIPNFITAEAAALPDDRRPDQR